jgi:hypothetical protein
VIDSEEIYRAVCGAADVAAFKRVKATSMRFADAARHVIAEELGGTMPESGKQFMDTEHGRWRLAPNTNSDNSTEASAHRRMGAKPVLMFGEPSAFRRAQGWISIEEFYELHGARLRPKRLIRLAAKRLDARAELPGSAMVVPLVSVRPIVRSVQRVS